MPYLEALNQLWFLQINATPASPDWLILLASFIAQRLLPLLPLWLAALWLWGRPALRDTVLKSCLFTLAALAGNGLIGMLWPHPRPFAVPLGHVFLTHDATPSFPSNHGTIFAMMALTWWFSAARGWGAALAAATIAVAWSRVYLGVHWPLDMVGAVLAAAAWFWLLSKLWARCSPTALAERCYRGVFAKPIALGWVRY